MIKKTFSYGRVSTDEQAFHRDGSLKKDASPEAQRQRCLEQAKFLSMKTGHQYKLIDHIADNACSGGNTNRPGYQRLWDLIGANQVDVVIATELSRLSRSVVDFLQLVKHCEAHKTDIVIIGLDLNTSAPFGRFLVIILIALAQLERETTGERVRENALIRLLKDGKINGAAEILGLDRDPQKPGHFLKNDDELRRVEKILNLFVKLSSKKKVLEAARELGLTGKNGRELTTHMLDIILENVKWRYRGLWYANKANKGVIDKSLPESQQYRTVMLPHGQLIDSELLDAVQEKVADTYSKKKKTGKDGYVYLLSHLLLHEDGSKFQGQPGKDRKYRYYYNQKHKLRIHCHEIESVVIGRMKDLISDDQLFETMLEDAIKRRMAELPDVERQLNQISKSLSEIEGTNHELAQRLADPTQRSEANFMAWLEEQVSTLRDRQLKLEDERDRLTHYKVEIERQQGLDNLKKTTQNFLKQFDGLTGTEKRNLLERFVEKIVLKPEKQLEIRFFGEPKAQGQNRTSVMRWNKSTGREGNGVTKGT